MQRQEQFEHQTTHCPTCNSSGRQVSFYPCCLQPNCMYCFDGFHLLECKNRVIHSILQHQTQSSPYHTCVRCESTLTHHYYICESCKKAPYCEQCLHETHQAPKFVSHNWKKVKVMKNQENGQTLQCGKHRKICNIITDKTILACTQCVSQNKCRKLRTIDFINHEYPNLLQEVSHRIQGLCSEITLKQEEHLTKWNQLRFKNKQAYQRLLEKINHRYQHNLSTLSKIQQFDLNVVNLALQKSQQCAKQLAWGINSNIQSTKDGYTFLARLNLMAQQLGKQKKHILSTEMQIHKIGQIEMEKLENILKPFTVCKMKVREQEKDRDKENLSGGTRKSSSKLNHSVNLTNNLTNSRRSLSRSMAKHQSLRSSVKILNKNEMNSSATNFSEKKCIPTTAQSSGNKNVFNSLTINSSIMNSPMQDIENKPVTLSFDSDSCTKINFYSKTEENLQKNRQKTNNRGNGLSTLCSSVTLESNANNSIADMFNRVGKRKSDYFDLRERMRKPNMVNRFMNRK